MKKLFFTLFTLCLAIYAMAGVRVGKLYYNLNSSDNTAEVTYQELSNNNYSGLTSVTIPETIVYNGTTYSVTSIGGCAFAECSSLSSIAILKSVKSIGSYAFAYCPSLTYITIPNSVTSIGEYAFSDCSSLTFVTIPNSVTSISYSAFLKCSSLTSITIPNSVKSIGDEAFRNCSSLTSVIIGNSVTGIGEYAFSDCSSLTSITIPNSVTSIERQAFRNCSSLTSITIPNSVKSIGSSAFKECSKLTSVTIGNSVTSIGYEAFYNCSSLTSIVVEANNAKYDSRDNCNAIIETATNILVVGCKNTIIPNSVTSIGSTAFAYCSSLDSITIPNSVTSIGDEAFFKCSSLTSITIPNSVKSIGSSAFAYCRLKSVTIPNSVTSIGRSAFSHCLNLTSVTIGESVTSIGEEAFNNCSWLTSVVWNAKNCANFSSSSYAPFYGSRFYIKSFTFGNSVEHIPAHLCCDMDKITSITIPNSVTSIGEGAFKYCISLTSITIPNSVKSIGSSAFSGCSKLTSVVWNAKNCADFSSSEAPFYDIRSQITSFIFGKSVQHIPAHVCYQMNKLTSITIPNSVTSIGSSAFHKCSSLTSITIPNSVKSIGSSAFSICRLKSVTIPNSVTNIGSSAFSGCLNLTSVTIGESVTSIGSSAFYDCPWITSITCKAITPPTLGKDAFRGLSNTIPVYVPCGLEDTYKFADGWNSFSNIQEPPTYSINVFAQDPQKGSVTLDFYRCNDSQISATANDGYHFTRWSDGNTDNPRTIVLTQDTVLFAEFAINVYTVTATAENGTIVGAGEYTQGATVTLTATANDGYHFTQWSDGNTDNPRTIVLTQDTALFAEFAINVYTVTATAENGTVVGAGEYTHGTIVTLTATANEGYHFVQWSDSNTENPRTFALTQDTALIAYFEYIVLDTEYKTICYSDSCVWNGVTYTTSGIYVDTLQTGIATLDLTILPEVPITEEEEAICSNEVYEWHGQIYTQSGDYSVTLSDINGCDSVVTLHLIVNKSERKEYTEVACDEYVWNGVTYTESGDYTFNTTTAAGCDCVEVLHLTINKSEHEEFTAVACDSYDWHGVTYTASGDYTYNTTTAAGCERVEVLHLTINKSEREEFTEVACDEYVWNGKNYTESGDYTYTTTAANGCDRIEILHLTVNKSEYVEETVTVCDSYDWHGVTYTVSGDYTYRTTAANGCNRVEVLHLTILPNAVTEYEDFALCPLELPYDWYGQSLTEAGTYTATEQYAAGCDSVVHELTLKVYVQTFPELVTLPTVREGEVIDVSIPTAEIQAHIAAETWYAPNAEVAWYIMENSDWAVLTTDPVKIGTPQVVLKYAVTTDCASIESEVMTISVETTAVDNIPTHQSDTYKIIRDDKLWIIRNGKIYSAQGHLILSR